MNSPVLVVIDLQRDFYHPAGSYGRTNRPLEPIQQVVEFLGPLMRQFQDVLRVQSIYRVGQFSDMPELCLPESEGRSWHPDLRVGPLLTKHKHSAVEPLQHFFDSRPELLLAGVCTHRCVRRTLRDLQDRQWPVKILKEGVASCGKRYKQHKECLSRWHSEGLVKTAADLESVCRPIQSVKQVK